MASEFVAFIVDQLAPLPELTAGRFFGGTALRAQGALFAMVMSDVLYFAVDDASRAAYERRGSRCFSYATRKGRIDVKRFYEAPADALEDADELLALARAAIGAAQRKAAAKPRRPAAKA
ncbi:MAG: TfoX/Sxy family protein [Solimonas sp.]